MPAAFRASAERRKLAARIATITTANGPADLRLPPLRDALDRLYVQELHDWAHRMLELQEPFNSAEIRQAARIELYRLSRPAPRGEPREALDAALPPPAQDS